MASKPKKTPREIGGFQISTKIGQGAMGAVFKARQVSMDRIVALKILPPRIAKQQPTFVERFVREARVSAKLNHANIVQGIEVGRDDKTGLYYFAMEYIDGPTIKEILRKEGVMEEKRALEIALKVAQALEVAQARGIVHRDIKPDNILMTSRGEPKLADLGLARRVSDYSELEEQTDDDGLLDQSAGIDANLTQSGKALGTPHYMAPEQVLGQANLIDTRTDLYALGATLYHMLTGRLPFTGSTSAEVMEKRLKETPPVARRAKAKLSKATSDLVHRLMQIDQEDRIQTPKALIAELEKVIRSASTDVNGGTTTNRRPVVAPTTGPRTAIRGAKGARRTQASASSPPVAAIGAGVLVLALVGLFIMSGSRQPQQAREKKESGPTARTDVAKQTANTNAGPKESNDRDSRKAIISESKTAQSGPGREEVDVNAEKNSAAEEAAPWADAIKQLDLSAAIVALEKHMTDKGLSEAERQEASARAKVDLKDQLDQFEAELSRLLKEAKINAAHRLLSQPKLPSTSAKLAAEAKDRLAALRTRLVETHEQAAKALRARGGPEVAAVERTMAQFAGLATSGPRERAVAFLKGKLRDPVLGILDIELEREIAQQSRLTELDKAVERGAAQLLTGRRIELLPGEGGKIVIGKGARYTAESVRAGALRCKFRFEDMETTKTIKLASLKSHSRFELAEMGAAGNPKGSARIKALWVHEAAVRATAKPRPDSFYLGLVENVLKKAKAAGAPEEVVMAAEPWLHRARERATSRTAEAPIEPPPAKNATDERRPETPAQPKPQPEDQEPAARVPETKKPDAKPNQAATVQGKKLTLDLGSRVKLELMRIEPGTFTMGTRDGVIDPLDHFHKHKLDAEECPPRKIKISRPFYMGKFEVTQAQYQKVVGENPSKYKGPTRPVETVSWHDAMTFCKKASTITKTRITLPTEAQWEYACKSKSPKLFWRFDDPGINRKPAIWKRQNKAIQDYVAWHPGNSSARTHPVGNRAKNAWGLYDMLGNVFEHCRDWYAPYKEQAATATDPTGPANGQERISRGGSFRHQPLLCRPSVRGYEFPSRSNAWTGFRVMVPIGADGKPMSEQ